MKIIRKTGMLMLCAVMAGSLTSNVYAKTPKVQLNYRVLNLVPGMKTRLKLKNAQGKITWKTSRAKIVSVKANGQIKAISYGKAVITAQNKKKNYRCSIIVRNKKDYTKGFVKSWVHSYPQKGETPYEKALDASYYVMTNFRYGNHYTAEDLLTKGSGTCVAGADLVARLCRAMGIPAKTRYAAKDPHSRYPSNISFASQHYNVLITIKGKHYYIDGTPGSMGIYLSNAKKPLYSANWILGSYMVESDHLPKK